MAAGKSAATLPTWQTLASVFNSAHPRYFEKAMRTVMDILAQFNMKLAPDTEAKATLPDRGDIDILENVLAHACLMMDTINTSFKTPLMQQTYDGLRDRIALQPALEKCLDDLVWLCRRGITLFNAFNKAALVVKDGDLTVDDFCKLLQALASLDDRQPDCDVTHVHKTGLDTFAALLKQFLSYWSPKIFEPFGEKFKSVLLKDIPDDHFFDTIPAESHDDPNMKKARVDFFGKIRPGALCHKPLLARLEDLAGALPDPQSVVAEMSVFKWQAALQTARIDLAKLGHAVSLMDHGRVLNLTPR